jgi:hypothetical protein
MSARRPYDRRGRLGGWARLNGESSTVLAGVAKAWATHTVNTNSGPPARVAGFAAPACGGGERGAVSVVTFRVALQRKDGTVMRRG